MRYFEDPILGKGRAADVSGGTGSADYVGGARIAIAGETISFVNSATIQNVTGNSVTLEPDTAYKITATASAVTLNANVPAAGQWAYEGHAEIFVAGTGYVVTGSNVVLANALEPDSVNNCTVRFHDGIAIISVEDHVYGYIVTSISGTTQGTLPYGITSATSNYIAFDATTNGSTIDLSGSTASAEKHIVGNGYNETTLTGAVDCSTAKVTVANLSLQDVGITGGTLTLGDAYIPSGSTVAVSGGGLAVEKVTGAGSESVINLNGTSMENIGISTNLFENIMIANGKGGAIKAKDDTTIRNVIISSSTVLGGIADLVVSTGHTKAVSCYFSYEGNSIFILGGTCTLTDCYYGGRIRDDGKLVISGTLHVPPNGDIESGIKTSGGSVTLTSGAILDLTGNTNATPIAPGGGITFESGGATVLYSSGAVSGSYMMDNVRLPAGAKLTNTAVVDLGSSFVTVSANQTAIVAGVTLQNGQNGELGAQILASSGGSAIASNTVFPGASGGFARCVAAYLGDSYVDLTGCTVTGSGTVLYIATAEMRLTGCDVQSGVINTQNSSAYLRLHGSNHIAGYAVTYGGGGHIEIADGAIVDFTGNSNSYVFYPANYNGTISYGANVTVITSAGDSVSLNGGVAGTCARLKNDGTTE